MEPLCARCGRSLGTDVPRVAVLSALDWDQSEECRDCVVQRFRLHSLRALAEAATPGPWEPYLNMHGDAYVCEKGRKLFGVIAHASSSPDDYGRANAEFIAACNPETIIELLDMLER